MNDYQFYIHTLIVITLSAIAASLLWMLWPVIAALLIGIGVYLVVLVLLRVFRARIDFGTDRKTEDTK